MTKEEAIEELEFDEHFETDSKKKEAYSMAIESLKQEPKTGHWIKDNPFIKPYCSECKTSCIGLHGFDYTLTNYCPNCGAKMESEVSE